MKKSVYIYMFLFVLLFSACAPSQMQIIEESESLPSESVFLPLLNGKTPLEIVEILGEPHQIEIDTNWASYKWNTKEGSVYCVRFAIPADTPQNLSFNEKLEKYGIAYEVVQEANNGTTEAETVIFDILSTYFDGAREHKPSANDIQSITPGMTISEVIKQIGKPHDFGPTSGLFSLSWEATTGEMFYIEFFIESNTPTESTTLERYLKHGVAGDCIPYPSGETTNQ